MIKVRIQKEKEKEIIRWRDKRKTVKIFGLTVYKKETHYLLDKD